MKKILLAVLLFLTPIPVFADALNLQDLTISNGEFSLPFDPLVNEYTIMVEKEVYNLEINYQVEEGVTVSIMDNFDLENNDVVTLILNKENKSSEYHLHILKEEEEQTLTTFGEDTPSIQNNFMVEYKIYIIPAVCLFLILVIHRILFHHKKKNI